eukprot:1179758-Prorocentrum_minimum.AAC.3
MDRRTESFVFGCFRKNLSKWRSRENPEINAQNSRNILPKRPEFSKSPPKTPRILKKQKIPSPVGSPLRHPSRHVIANSPCRCQKRKGGAAVGGKGGEESGFVYSMGLRPSGFKLSPEYPAYPGKFEFDG